MKCIECRIEMKKEIREHRYVESGLSNVILKNIEIFTCSNCDEEEIVIPNPLELHNLIATNIANKQSRLRPEEVRFLRKHLGYSGVDFAKKMKVTHETVSRWENGRVQIPISAEMLLRLFILNKFDPKLNYEETVDDLASIPTCNSKRLTLKQVNCAWKVAA